MNNEHDRPSSGIVRALLQALRCVDGCSLYALRVLLTKGPAAARRVIGSALQALHPRENPWLITEWELARAFATPQPVVVDGGDWMDGSMAPLERFMMALLLRHFEPHLLVEVGTYRGITTRLLLDNLTDAARVFTIDLPPGADAAAVEASTDARLIATRDVGIAYRTHPRAGQVTQVLGNTFEPGTWSQVPAGVEFAFIDASHSYEAVRNDTERLWPKLAADAVVLWHDYTEGSSPERGVGQYLRELIPREPGIFLCQGTTLAFRLPIKALADGADRQATWFPDGSYPRRFRAGVPAWRRGALPRA